MKPWPRERIADLCEAIVDCVNRTAPTVPTPTPYKMIRTTNVKSGWIKLDEVKFVTEDVFRRWNRRLSPDPGDVVLTREAPLGEVGMIRKKDNIFLGQRLVLYRTDKAKLDNRFLLYSFQAADLQGQIRSLGSGSTVEHMRVPDAKELTVATPPIATQRKIAAVLSAYDDLIENNTRRIKILEEMAQALYREWFVHFRFPGHEKIRIVDSEIGPIPEGWIAATLGDIAREVRRSISIDQVDPETAYVGLEHIPRRSIALYEWGKAKDVQSMKLRFDKGDILFGKIRPYFHKVSVAPIDGITSSDAIVIKAKQPENYAVTLCCVSSDDFVLEATQTSQGTKMPRANWDVLTRYPIALPPLPLLSQFNGIVLNVVHQVENLTMKSRNLRQTRDLLLPKLISGEIDVAQLDITTGEMN